MNAGELIEYMKGFKPDSKVAITVANVRARKKYLGCMYAITDMEQPVLMFDVWEETDLDEDWLEGTVQSELDAQQEGGAE